LLDFYLQMILIPFSCVRIIGICLGVPPTEFSWEYYDKSKEHHKVSMLKTNTFLRVWLWAKQASVPTLPRFLNAKWIASRSLLFNQKLKLNCSFRSSTSLSSINRRLSFVFLHKFYKLAYAMLAHNRPTRDKHKLIFLCRHWWIKTVFNIDTRSGQSPP
jgi:Peptidase C1-like family